MTDAVIVATARSPIGRAAKGSMVDIRPDDLSAQILTALMDKVPEVSGDMVEDVIMGCGQPAGEAGFNIGRVAALLAGIDAPGVTVNRYCSSRRCRPFGWPPTPSRPARVTAFVAAGTEVR